MQTAQKHTYSIAQYGGLFLKLEILNFTISTWAENKKISVLQPQALAEIIYKCKPLQEGKVESGHGSANLLHGPN